MNAEERANTGFPEVRNDLFFSIPLERYNGHPWSCTICRFKFSSQFIEAILSLNTDGLYVSMTKSAFELIDIVLIFVQTRLLLNNQIRMVVTIDITVTI